MVTTSQAPTIESLRSAIKTPDVNDPEIFAGVVWQARIVLGESAALKLFGISRPTLQRWCLPENAPHPQLRSYVYGWLRDATATTSALHDLHSTVARDERTGG